MIDSQEWVRALASGIIGMKNGSLGRMRIGWIGFHVEGLPALEAIVAERFPSSAVITLRPEATRKRSGF